MEDRINYQFQSENLKGLENEESKVNLMNQNVVNLEDDLDEDEIDKKRENEILTDYNRITSNHVNLSNSIQSQSQDLNSQNSNDNTKNSSNSLYYLEALSTESNYTYRVVYPVDSNL